MPRVPVFTEAGCISPYVCVALNNAHDFAMPFTRLTARKVSVRPSSSSAKGLHLF